MRTRFIKIASLTATVMLLSACGTIDDMFKSDRDDVVVINATDGSVQKAPPPVAAAPPAAPAQVSSATPAPGQPYGGSFDPNNLMSVYNQISGTSGVSTYDGANPGTTYPPLTNQGGVPAPQDSRVTLFPLEGDASDYIDPAMVGGGMDTAAYGQDSYAALGGSSPPPVSSAAMGTAQIYFEHGSARLSARDNETLAKVAEQAKFSPVDRISVEGHASARANTGDPVSDSAANLKESMNRTYAVSRSLIKQGVPADKIRATSWGDTRNPPGMPEDQARRVDVYTGAAP